MVNFKESILFAVFLYDVWFLYSLYNFHILHGHEEGHDTHYGVLAWDELRFVLPSPDWALRIHVAGGVVPLVFSLSQVSKAVRSKSLFAHRWMGRFVLLSSVVCGVPSYAIGLTNADTTQFDRFLIMALATCWFVSIVLTWYYAWIGNIATHRRWAVRFACYTHTVPLLGRVIAPIAWMYLGRPTAWKDDPTMPSDPTIFPLIVRVTTVVLFLISETFVYLESPASPPPPPKKTD